MEHAGAGVNGGQPESSFLVHRLGNDHAEGITTLDMNGDGYLDLVSGAYWYENPGTNGGNWKRHQWRTVSTTGEFVSDCGEWTVDVNHDGAPDIITAGWITNGLWWYENPKQQGVMWRRHLIADSFDTEGGVFADINGDGKPDIALAHYNHSGILWVDFSGPTPRVHHLLPTAADGHGIGLLISTVTANPTSSRHLDGFARLTPMPTNGSGIRTGTSGTPDFPSSAMTSTMTAAWISSWARVTVTDSIGGSKEGRSRIPRGRSTSLTSHSRRPTLCC